MALTQRAGFPAISSGTGVLTKAVTTVSVGDVLLVVGRVAANVTLTSVSGGGASDWRRAGDLFDPVSGVFIWMWWGRVVSTGAQTVTLAFSGSVAANDVEIGVDSWGSDNGQNTAWTVDAEATIIDTATVTSYPMPTLTPSGANDFYGGYIRANGGAAGNGGTAGFAYTLSANGNGYTVNGVLTPAVSVAPVFSTTTSGSYVGISALVNGGAVRSARVLPLARNTLGRGVRDRGQMALFIARVPKVVVAAGPVANQSALTGALSFTGAAPRLAVAKGISGGLSFAGARSVAVVKLLAAAVLTFAGAQSRRTAKLLSAAVSLAGAQSRAMAKLLAGALSFTGARAVAITKRMSAGLGFTGARAIALVKALGSAALSFTGSLSAGKQFVRALSGTLSFTGSLAAQHAIIKALSATLSFAGSQTRAIRTGLAATLSFTGRQSKAIATHLSAGLAFSGAITRRIAKGLAAALSSAGQLVTQAGHFAASVLITPPTLATIIAYVSHAAIAPYSSAAALSPYTSTSSLRAYTSTVAIAAYAAAPAIVANTAKATLVTYTSSARLGPTYG